jgi:hypothetical protein
MLTTAGMQQLPVFMIEAVAFIVLPLLVYVVVRAAVVYLQGCTLRAVQALFQSKVGTSCMRLERACRIGAAVVTQTCMTALIMWVLVVGPIALPAGLDPFLALDAAKDNLLSMLERMDLDWRSQSVSARGLTLQSCSWPGAALSEVHLRSLLCWTPHPTISSLIVRSSSSG